MIVDWHDQQRPQNSGHQAEGGRNEGQRRRVERLPLVKSCTDTAPRNLLGQERPNREEQHENDGDERHDYEGRCMHTTCMHTCTNVHVHTSTRTVCAAQ